MRNEFGAWFASREDVPDGVGAHLEVVVEFVADVRYGYDLLVGVRGISDPAVVGMADVLDTV